MTSRFVSATALILCAVSFTGCSAGFKGAGSTASLNGTTNIPTPGPGTINQNWSKVSMDATVQAPSVGPVLAVTLDKPNKQLVIHLPLVLGTNGVIIGNTLSIPQLPGTTLGFETVGSTTALTLRIPLATLMHGASFLPSGQLPNGDSLTTVGIANGELPNLGISLNNSGNFKASIYLDAALVGIYLTSPVNPFISAEFPIQLADKTTIGYLSTVRAKGSFPGGFFLSVKVPNDIAAIIDDVVN